nr:MAG TPA: hypothetical protein [Caudoviricetes sp.]
MYHTFYYLLSNFLHLSDPANRSGECPTFSNKFTSLVFLGGSTF